MNKIINKIGLAFAFVFAVLAASCSGNSDETLIDDGLVHLSSDKTTILANGVDKVTFTVKYGLTDISDAKTMCLKVIDEEGGVKELAGGANAFSTTTAGTYRIFAEYTKGGRMQSVDTITVTAVEVEKSKYKQCLLGMYFTSEGCSACPNAAKSLKELQAAYPGLIKAASFHLDFLGVMDFLSIAESQNYLQFVFSARSQLPQFYFSLRKTDNGASPTYVKMEQDLLTETSEYHNTCGVAIDTYFDNASRTLNIDAKVTSDVENEYRYVMYIVEDGIPARVQAGVNGEYIHNNVVRKVLGSIAGERFPAQYRPVPANQEVVISESTVIPEDCNVENMRVIVTILSTLDDGMTYTSNNTNECKLGGSVDYLLNE